MIRTQNLSSALASLAYSAAAVAAVALTNAGVVYLGLLPCGISDGRSSLCRGLVYENDGDGTYLLTPHSAFYYPAHVLLVLPTMTLAGWFVARDVTSAQGPARHGVSGFVWLTFAYVIAFVVSVSFTRIAFGARYRRQRAELESRSADASGGSYAGFVVQVLFENPSAARRLE